MLFPLLRHAVTKIRPQLVTQFVFVTPIADRIASGARRIAAYQPSGPTKLHSPQPSGASALKDAGLRLSEKEAQEDDDADFWAKLEARATTDPNPVHPGYTRSHIHKTRPFAILDAEAQSAVDQAKAKVKEALQQENPYELLRAFYQALEDHSYVTSIPSTAFIEILRLLDPSYFIEPFRTVYQDLHDNQIAHLEDGTGQLQELFADYVETFHDIVQIRRAANCHLGIEEYRLMLNCARSVGDETTANALWGEMSFNDVAADTHCYNSYMEAKCWSRAYESAGRRKLRVIPFLKVMRLPARGHFRKQFYPGYQTGDHGVKNTITRLFSRMLEAGVEADAKTFSLLMIAMAREGDLEGVSSILKRLWDVDVEAVMGQEDEFIEPSTMSRQSPLFPTDDFLFTIAHIFGSNNDVPRSLRIVDYISRKYSISIDIRVWSELLTWTFVLSTPRDKTAQDRGFDIGKLPTQSVQNLWSIMTSEPYNVRPTISMINQYIRNLWTRDMLDPMLDQMRYGKSLHRQQLRAYLDQHRNLRKAEEEVDLSPYPPEPGFSIHALRVATEIQRLREYADWLTVSRWFRLLLAGRRWAGGDEGRMDWQRRRLPSVVAEFYRYRPRAGIIYTTATCRVEFHPGFEKEEMVVNMAPSAWEDTVCIWDAQPFPIEYENAPEIPIPSEDKGEYRMDDRDGMPTEHTSSQSG